ncbi:hypothetical protein [Enterobacillus tribolii]|uniref:Uncharacterized protein n=1 Tax=Enterobacillus tribolii TaxID=1487935 RepID=A0A370QHI5_9GAMM|nr:hypothetical protein [Enterobacillus tribolii]MBW7982545.1 hypothetical protein [Enterobacillus tribolii]RDK87825.1 hypothetical protein C8D90_10893 [Enterobacillus tribolii]
MAPASLTRQLLHRLRVKNVWAGVLVACWMLLNAQMAIAGHRCAMQIDGPMPSVQHMSHGNAGADMPHHSAMQSAEMLCEQHCAPDGIHQETADHLPLLAVPLVSTELRIADLSDDSLPGKPAWSPPPPTAPPAEIRFCRFRE